MIVDRKIFEQYIARPNPYAKFMREEFIKNKEKVSDRSYIVVKRIDEEVDRKYKF